MFSPLDIGPIRVRNRVVRPAHLTKFSFGPTISEDLIGYHVARGRGGVGLSILEATAVHPSSVLGLIGWDDAIIDGYHRLVDAVRPTGMRLFQQLWHAGHVYNPPDGSPPRGVSRLPSPVSGVPAVPWRTDELPGLVTAFADAAQRSVTAGIDGIEIAASHGYLLHQFLSPLTNDRTDSYGGTLENRMRLLVEILQGVRVAIGPEKALGMRIGAGQVHGDLGETELAQVVRHVEGLGLIDYLNVTMGDYYAMAEMTGAMDRPAGYQLPSSGTAANSPDWASTFGSTHRSTLQRFWRWNRTQWSWPPAQRHRITPHLLLNRGCRSRASNARTSCHRRSCCPSRLMCTASPARSCTTTWVITRSSPWPNTSFPEVST